MKPQRLAHSVTLALAVTACGSSDASGSTDSSESTVVVQNYKFPDISAIAGATLTLIDKDDEQHTLTADDGSFKGGPFNNKAPGTLAVPTKAGTYLFHCEIHPTMHGTLVVRDS
jgi:plastocyanin